MSKFDTAASPAAPIPRSALVAGAGGGQPELTRDLRAVAMQAVCEWTRSHAASSEPTTFGQQAAQVYLAALRELEAGFGPAPAKEW